MFVFFKMSFCELSKLGSGNKACLTSSMVMLVLFFAVINTFSLPVPTFFG